MSDLPENLHIKRELSPPTTPEEKSPNSIKAKLNLHVKRRLQDTNQTNEENTASVHNKPPVNGDIKQDKIKTETAVRQKRPYHKRADKNKIVTPANTSLEIPLTTISAASLGITTTTPQRKYKHKIKQSATTTVDNKQELLVVSKTEEQTSVVHQNASITTGAVSPGDDDEGGHDNDLKSGREKEKCPDILAMVLSMKKRTLMQDPEVQKFLKDIMEVIKS